MSPFLHFIQIHKQTNMNTYYFAKLLRCATEEIILRIYANFENIINKMTNVLC